MGYIRQQEDLFSFLTVQETIYLNAKFCLPTNASKETIDGKVEEVLSSLGLSEIGGTMVGSQSKKGISGGEYKRLLIGKELLRNPSILFLDEPTSGLDSFQALKVMETMNDLTKQHNKIVISVLHQPRSGIFTLFDIVLIMSAGVRR